MYIHYIHIGKKKSACWKDVAAQRSMFTFSLFSADRVVDKLNPVQVFTKQEVLKLLDYSDEELPKIDFSNLDHEFDPILRDACQV